MTPSPRPDHRLNLDGLPQVTMSGNKSSTGSSASSPSEQPAGSGLRFPLNNSLASAAGAPNGPGRAGAGSPSKEYGSRLFPKRAREIQAQEGVPPQIWGPPTTGSGHSTPLRETIPESPSSDNFPDFDVSQGNLAAAQAAIGSQRRARAGTVPSRFPAVSLTSGLAPSNSVRNPSSRGTPPALSPYLPGTPLSDQQAQAGAQANAILSRYRAGSMPQRASLLNGSSPFGSSVFASNWLTGRERASTLQSIRSSDAPSSPRESPGDNDIRTLDYLGLVDTPQQNNLQESQRAPGAPLTVAEMIAMNALAKNTANRFRSYSVNAKEKYADNDEYDLDQYDQMMDSGQITPATDASAAQAAAIHEAVRQHNLEVQAFANFASASRPRARTAGILDSPTSRALRSFVPTPSRLDNSMTAADLSRDADYAGLASAVQGMKLGSKASIDGFDSGLDNPTRSLWLGNIPSSTTISSLNALFSHFGPIEFARVLTHKSCGFVNFENIQSAIAAKAQYNGKEIFPGCGPVRIGFAKEQSTSNTPGGANGAFSSPSPDPFVSKSRADPSTSTATAQNGANINAETAAAALATPNLVELKEEMFNIISAFGANQEDTTRMSTKFDEAMRYDGYIAEIPPVLEPSQTRVHDAPRLRDIRKRIDNNTCSPVEIESIAIEMLPEIAELSSDYLGNTVVQKLFEHCAEDTKEAMLKEIAPRLADIGVHKNGTWAAQKIIDVANTPQQITTIAEALRPYAVGLFLDQYGNYVIQCCLRFQSPDNNYIFDTMVAKLWDVAQGRFGARAVRACLESHFATNDQKRLMAAAITMHSVQLATNSNGALLLTWFLDTCTFPRRRSVLAPRLIPHLVHLCTHKVAYLTVLKIINQRNEPEARDQILHALFMNEETLSDVVSDQACGATFVFKVLTTPFLDESVRPDCVQNVRNVLIRVKAQPSQGYKRLMDEVGLSNRHGAAVPQDGRSSSKIRGDNAQAMYSNMAQGYDSPDPQAGYDAYNNITPAQYTHSPSMAAAGMSPQQIQYSQGMLPQQQMSRPPGFMNGAPGNGMQGYGNAASPGPMFDPYRQGMASPAMIGHGYQQQQAFGMGGYGQYNGSQYMTQGQMAGNGGGRRGRQR